WTPRHHAHGQLDDGRPYIVMERLFGATLGDRMAERLDPMPAAQAVAIVEAIAASLAAAHGRGPLHRDLKPDNVFVADEGQRVALLDFGLTRRLDGAAETDLTSEGAVLGTPEYMAPEQLHAAREVGPAADVYALGVILYELLTLR